MWQAIAQQISQSLELDFAIAEREPLNVGEINQCSVISDGQTRLFVKTNHKDHLPHYHAEADNLTALLQTETLLVPNVTCYGVTKINAFLVASYFPTKPLTDITNAEQFGQQLAQLHLWGEQKEFGFDQDNYFTDFVQPNCWHKKWCTFYAEQRIGWQLQLLKEKGVFFTDIDNTVNDIKLTLANHTPTPSLLHGNLSNKNIAQTYCGVITFNPACYWGDRECDLAQLELSPPLLDAFMQGYQTFYPLSDNYLERQSLYQLYPLLVKCNLYGGNYLQACIEQLKILDLID